MDAAAITQSFEIAAERCPDITPLVYDKLFARYPEIVPLFVRDTNGAVRGEMLSRTIELIFDLIGGDHWASNFVRAEIVTHNAYGVPVEIFPRFFSVLAETLKELLGPEWTPQIDAAWESLLGQLTATMRETVMP